jgi:hypothetical protein
VKTRWLLRLVAGTYVAMVGIVFVLQCLSRSGLQPSVSPDGARPRAISPPVDPKVVALIDQLTEVTDEGPGTHSTAWASGFMAVDENFRFRGGILGSHKPVVHPAMRELVRLGVAALPELLNHLSDPRNTGLVINPGGFMGSWHSDEYSPRYDDPARQQAGVNSGQERDCHKEYRLRVGDLCYVAVGQIVNRGLWAVRYQPTLCQVINSPVQTPALAAAARQDWSGLTAEQHQESLVADALGGGLSADPGALVRLYYYYPVAAEPVALKLLARRWYDSGKVIAFVKGPLLRGNDIGQWKSAIAAFAVANGPVAAEVVPAWLNRCYLSRSSETEDDFLRQKAAAKKILTSLYPDYNPANPPFLNAATETDQRRLVEELSGIRSKKLDDAISQLYRSLDLERFHGVNRVYADDLALACMERLVGKGMDEGFKAYCERRIRELEGQEHLEIGEKQRLEFLGEMLQRLEGRQPNVVAGDGGGPSPEPTTVRPVKISRPALMPRCLED